MTRKTHDLCVKTGSYTDRDGNEKGRWMNVGALMEDGEGRPFVMLNACFNPAGIQREEGRESILVSCFVPEDQRTDDRGQRGTTHEERQPMRHGDRPGGAYNRR